MSVSMRCLQMRSRFITHLLRRSSVIHMLIASSVYITITLGLLIYMSRHRRMTLQLVRVVPSVLLIIRLWGVVLLRVMLRYRYLTVVVAMVTTVSSLVFIIRLLGTVDMLTVTDPLISAVVITDLLRLLIEMIICVVRWRHPHI